jgi:hypothetical protein
VRLGRHGEERAVTDALSLWARVGSHLVEDNVLPLLTHTARDFFAFIPNFSITWPVPPTRRDASMHDSCISCVSIFKLL